jgi:hypothetical protein
MQKSIETKYYTIDEHPNIGAVYHWINENWHDLGDCSRDEVIDSLKSIASALNAELDYQVSAVPDRGEYIDIKHRNCDSILVRNAFDWDNLTKLSDECKFTGVCYDTILSCALSDLDKNTATLKDLSNQIERVSLKSIHDETIYLYSDSALFDMCEANEYYFDISGAIE